MEQTSDQAPPDGNVEPQRPAGWRRWKPSETTAWILFVVMPIALFVFTQVDLVQNARGWFVRDLTDWDLGKKDIVAPIWVVSIVAAAALGRRMLRYYPDSPSPPDATPVPILIQIDNGYENPGAAPAGSSPIEVLIPIRALIASQFGRIANAREQAAIEFDRPFDVGGRHVEVTDPSGTRIVSRYARITTRAHPGVQAPLGWTLSNASFDDLRSQLTIEENRAELAEIQRWLNEPLTCRDQG